MSTGARPVNGDSPDQAAERHVRGGRVGSPVRVWCPQRRPGRLRRAS